MTYLEEATNHIVTFFELLAEDPDSIDPEQMEFMLVWAIESDAYRDNLKPSECDALDGTLLACGLMCPEKYRKAKE